MNKAIWVLLLFLILALIGLVWHSSNAVETTLNKIKTKKADLTTENSLTLDSIPKTEFNSSQIIPQDTCDFDSVYFKQIMGKGVMGIGFMQPYNYYHSDSITMFNANDTFIIRHYDLPNEYWGIKINHEPYENFINHFLPKDFAHNTEFIWKSGSKENNDVIIQSFHDEKSFLLEASDKYYLIPWNNYLNERLISLDTNFKIHREPNDTSLISFQNNSAFFRTVAVKNDWMQLSYLNPNDIKGELANEPIGWYKWYCNGFTRVHFLNDIDMEGYYLD